MSSWLLSTRKRGKLPEIYFPPSDQVSTNVNCPASHSVGDTHALASDSCAYQHSIHIRTVSSQLLLCCDKFVSHTANDYRQTTDKLIYGLFGQCIHGIILLSLCVAFLTVLRIYYLRIQSNLISISIMKKPGTYINPLSQQKLGHISMNDIFISLHCFS